MLSPELECALDIEADALKFSIRDSYLPESDAHSIKAVGNLSPEVDIGYFPKSTAYHRPSVSKANIQPYILQGLVEWPAD